MNKIGKYEFDSLEQAEDKITALGVATDDDGNTYPTHKHCIVKLGYIVLKQGQKNEESEEVNAPCIRSLNNI